MDYLHLYYLEEKKVAIFWSFFCACGTVVGSLSYLGQDYLFLVTYIINNSLQISEHITTLLNI
jgi:hypothetical protein